MNSNRVKTRSIKRAESIIDQNKLRVALERQGNYSNVKDYRQLEALCVAINVENTKVNRQKVYLAAKTIQSKNLTRRKVTTPKRFNSNDFVLDQKVKRISSTNSEHKHTLKTHIAADRNWVLSSDKTCTMREDATEQGPSKVITSPDKSVNRYTKLTKNNSTNSILVSKSRECHQRGYNTGCHPPRPSPDGIEDCADENPSDDTGCVKLSSLLPGDHQSDVDNTDGAFSSSVVNHTDWYHEEYDNHSNNSTENPSLEDDLSETNHDLDRPTRETSFEQDISTEDSHDVSFNEHSIEQLSSDLSYETETTGACQNSSLQGNSEEIMDATSIHETKRERPESFTITLNKSEWKTIKPKKHEQNRKLCSSWTDIFSEKLANSDVPCVLLFYYNRIKRRDSKKINARYFHGKAKCKFETCTWYTFEIAEKPVKVSKNGVTIKVLRHGQVNHPPFQTKKRQLRGERRQLYKQQLKNKGASNLHYELLGNLSQSQLDGGNHTIPSTKQVLRQLKYEMTKEEYLHSDEWTEVVMTKNILQDLDQDSNCAPGYIQLLSYQPFIAICFNERQIQIFRHQKKMGRGVLYLDATGSLVKKQCGSNKPVYYYAAVVKNNKPNQPPMPIAEMFTNEHTTEIISLFLGKMKQVLMATGSSWHSVQPMRVETDFSWSLINSALLVCNQENITAYLSRAWQITKGSKALTKFTKVHLCSAHLIKRVRDRLGRTTSDKGLCDFYTYTFALLQNSSELRQAESIYISLCTALENEYETPPVKAAIAKLEKQIVEQTLDVESSAHSGPQKIEEDLQQENLLPTIKALSPFNKFFASVKENIPSNEEYTSEVKNKYYNKEALAVIESYLHLYPVWSGLLLRNEIQDNGKPVTRDTNCFVENWFRIVKHDILNKKQLQRPGPVLRLLHKSLQGRLREYQISMESKMLPDQDLSTTESATLEQDDIDVYQEQWRPVSKIKTSKFYTRPNKIPGPTLPEENNIKPKRGQKRSFVSSRQGEFTKHITYYRSEDNWMGPLLQAICVWLPHPIPDSNDGILDLFLKKLIRSTYPEAVYQGDLTGKIKTSPEYCNMEFGEDCTPVTFLHQFLQRMQNAQLIQPMLIKKDLECQSCGMTESSVEEKLLTLMVHLTAPTVQECIDNHFKPKIPSTGTQQSAIYYTQKCTKCRAFTDQKRSVLEASDGIVIILKRFTESPRKHQDSVRIQKQISIAVENEIYHYNLQSIQLHHGDSVHGGNYTAISVTPKGITSFNGETTTEKGQDFLQSPEVQMGCYMLFYNMTDQSEKTLQYSEHNGSSTAPRRLELDQQDIRTLEAKNWLNDQVVNAYMAILEEKYPVRCFDSFLLEEIKRTRVSKMPKDINTAEFLFIPIHQQSHWSLIVIDVQRATISFLDPLGISNETSMQVITNYLRHAGLSLVRDKQLEKKFPIQKNNYDCGVYILEYARCIASHQRCTQTNMKKGRQNIKHSIEEVYQVTD